MKKPIKVKIGIELETELPKKGEDVLPWLEDLAKQFGELVRDYGHDALINMVDNYLDGNYQTLDSSNIRVRGEWRSEEEISA